MGNGRTIRVNVDYDVLNARLNASETMLRQRLGAHKVSALIRQFKVAAEDDPALFAALYKKRDPYRWLAQYWAPKQQRRDHWPGQQP